MQTLKGFLFERDFGVKAEDNKLHIGVSFLEHVITAAEIFHFAVPTTTAAGAATVGFATVGGLTLAATGPILGAAGVFMALGSGYEEARRIISNRAVKSGFSQGLICGFLRMSKNTVKRLFFKQFVIHSNVWDPEADEIETRAYNKGLVAGYLMGNEASEEERKAFLSELRQYTGDVHVGDWGDREKTDYVITYGAKLNRHYLPEGE